jgi:hypothetical protein
MTRIPEHANEQDSKPIAGDTVFLGGMVTVFSILFPGFGVVGLTLGGVLILSGCCLGWRARRRDRAMVRVTTRLTP